MSLFDRIAWICLAALLATGSVAEAQIKIEPNTGFDPQEAATRGRALVGELLNRKPEPSDRTNILRIESADGKRREVKVRFQTLVTPTNWVAIYEVVPGQRSRMTLAVTSQVGKPNIYHFSNAAPAVLSGDQTMVPFAGSDFWAADLGLEFLHWPQQKVIKQEMRKSQACDVLESTNPNPSAMGYTKVVSWIDSDSGGIVHADAYDSSGKILKRFEPSEIQRVDGRMQVKEIRMSNRKTGSRSWVVFDLTADANAPAAK